MAVVCDQTYQRYLPVFVLFVAKSYPTYGIQVFMQGKVSCRIRKAIERFASERVRIRNNFIPEWIRNKQALKTYRWMLGEELFAEFENIYVGDVDLLICREDPGLEEVHLSHCDKNSLPYSNCVRPGAKRLSGLHFYRKRPYYEVIGPMMRSYMEHLVSGAIDFTSTRNENVLYKMIVESGLGLPHDQHRIDIDGSGPHHGLHLGIWRKGANPNEAVVDQIFRDGYADHYAFFRKLEEQGLLSGRACRLVEIENMKAFFSAMANRGRL